MSTNCGRFTALAAVSPNASVTVRSHGSTTAATLYATRSGTTTTTNPVVANERGDIGFFVEYGTYDLVLGDGTANASVTVTVRPDPLNAWPTA